MTPINVKHLKINGRYCTYNGKPTISNKILEITIDPFVGVFTFDYIGNLNDRVCSLYRLIYKKENTNLFQETTPTKLPMVKELDIVGRFFELSEEEYLEHIVKEQI